MSLLLSPLLALALAVSAPARAGTLPAPDLRGGAAAPAAAAAPDARDAAQRGLDFLASATVAWQQQQKCYGCHVQAHALEAMSVGVANQYKVRDPQLRQVIAGLTSIDGGTRTRGGLRYAHGGTLVAPSQGFGGAAIARYDGLVDGALTDDLLQVARALEAYQQQDGLLKDPGNWVNEPVGMSGAEQLTYQGIATWRQAYERTADDRWMAAAGQAEDALRGVVAAYTGQEPTQRINYGLLGLVHAGATPSEAAVAGALATLQGRQNDDGGWGQHAGAGSDALATGQTLYTLRKLGLTEGDAHVARGMAWLVARQNDDGGWSHEGEAKAEAMWAVLGLVSTDVMSLAFGGVEDGQHVSGTVMLTGRAAHNDEGEVRRVELRVDDRVVATGEGAALQTALDAATLETGRHVLELRATDDKGRTARRRIEVYAGDVFLARVSTRWDDGGTTLSARDIAPAGRPHTVRLTLKRDEGGEPGATLQTFEEPGRQGPVQFWWDGSDATGGTVHGVRVHAVFEVLEGGAVVQTESTPFVHADPAWRQERFAGVQGRIDLGGEEDAVNTLVELVDGAGRVVGSAMTTDQGQYRFDDLDAGKYKVRVRKKGWEDKEAEVEAAPAAAAAEANVSLD
jgi:squalene-hopene/tetraprenyl-beta-curcumene cyclase